MSRNRWTLGLCGLFVLAACRAAGDQHYTIDGDAAAITQQGTALLWRFGEAMEVEEIARVPIAHGRFRFSGTVDWICPAGIAILAAEEVDKTLAKTDLILEPGQTRVVMRKYPQEAQIQGGPYYRKVFASWQQDPRYIAAAKKADEINARMDDKMPEADSAKLWQEANRHQREALGIESEVLAKVYASDPDPLVRFLAFEQKQMADGMTGKMQDAATRIAALEALQKQLPGNVQVTRAIGRIKEVEERLANSKAIKPGAAIHDFTAPDIDGKEFRLSQVFQQQKYVLVEFWASWCGPCRAEIPNLKQAYQGYHDKGFEIVSFSLDDKMAAWRKASDEEKLPWVNTCDLKAFGSPIIKMFGVLGVPANYLVDRNGTIVDMNLRGKALEQKLGELL